MMRSFSRLAKAITDTGYLKVLYFYTIIFRTSFYDAFYDYLACVKECCKFVLKLIAGMFSHTSAQRMTNWYFF